MNKIIKRKLIGAIICFVVGISCIVYLAINHENISEELLSYISGFATGIISIAIITVIKYTRIMKNEQMSKKIENANNDERLKVINSDSMAISFRISVLFEALTSIICAICGKMEIAAYFGFLIGLQLILYLAVYFIVSKKN